MSYTHQRALYAYGPRGYGRYHDTTPHGTRTRRLSWAQMWAEVVREEDTRSFWREAFG